MLVLQAVTPNELSSGIPGLTIEEARRIVGAIHRHDHLPKTVRGVRRLSLENVRATGTIPSLTIREMRSSKVDPFVKYSLEASDGEVIETVKIPLEKPGRYSVCVSSQAGCGFGCAFCATGRMGFRRNLDTWEIVEQIRVVRRSLDLASRQRVHGVVFQGMGEPLANLDNVIHAIRVASEPSGLAIDGRTITVCTAGLPPGILKLAREAPKVRLGISITSVRPAIRTALMPVEKAYPLPEVLDATAEHARMTGLAPMWAFTLLEGINDSEADALELAQLARAFAGCTGLRPRISIIPYNSIDLTGPQTFTRSSPARELEFRNALRVAGVPSHKRYSGGSDVEAACGQLAGIQPYQA
jgi:23S rRNA (adenine2503-C2)-methyltransferase